MKKIFISILFIMTFSLVIGLSSSSNPVLANPLIEEIDDLIVLEGDLANVDVEALVAEVIVEDSLLDVDEITHLIEETIANSRAVFVLNQPLHLSLFLDGLIANNGDTILLGSNINMTGFGPFTGRSYFNGIFNGNGFTVSNLRIESASPSVGFINESSEITLENVTFDNFQVMTSPSRVTGGLVGTLDGYRAFGTSLIKNVNITGNSIVQGGDAQVGFVGGFVGSLLNTSLEITNSTTYAAVITSARIEGSLGGFVGDSQGSNITIESSENHGSVNTMPFMGSHAGGFIGAATGTCSNVVEILNSTNYGPVSSDRTGLSVGGLIGTVGNINGGEVTVNIINSANHGNIRGGGVNIGGIIGSFYGTCAVSLMDVYNSGNVTGGHHAKGGIIGSIWSRGATVSAEISLVNVTNSGGVTGGNNVGGIIGYIQNAYVTIKNSHNSGTIQGINYLGGLVGNVVESSYVVIEDCVNSGLVIGSGIFIGNIVGLVSPPAIVVII